MEDGGFNPDGTEPWSPVFNSEVIFIVIEIDVIV